MSYDADKKQEFINNIYLYGITYMYYPKEENNSNNSLWINTNTNHMKNLLHIYDVQLEGYNYSIMIRINNEVKYISKDYKSIINYFIDNKKEYTNNILKKIQLQYVIDM
jgi:hypothetical protein